MLPEGGFMNAEKFFQQMFGGEKFQSIIGDLALGKLLGEMAEKSVAEATATATVKTELDNSVTGADGMNADKESSHISQKGKEDDMFSKEKMAEHQAVHAARVNQLVSNLIEKTRSYVIDKNEDALQFKARMQKEAAELREESYGPELLATIGYTYQSKAEHYLTKDEWYGVKGFIGTIRDKGHIIGRVVDTVGAMREADPKKRASQPGQNEEDAIERAQREEALMMNTLWKANSLEVELTLREVCVSFLSYNTVPGYTLPLTVSLKKQLKPVLKERARALQILGQCYQAAGLQPTQKKV